MDNSQDEGGNIMDNKDLYIRNTGGFTRQFPWQSILMSQSEDYTRWDDLRVPAQNTKLNPSKSEPAFESWIDGLFTYHFDASNADDESIHFVCQVPHNYKLGTDLHPHIHWSPDNTNTGNVYWSFEYSLSNINGTFGSSTTDDILAAADGVENKHQIDEFTAIDGTNITLSSMIVCRLTRKSTSEATDTFTGNAVFLEFDFHYQIDSLGSYLEYQKSRLA